MRFRFRASEFGPIAFFLSCELRNLKQSCYTCVPDVTFRNVNGCFLPVATLLATVSVLRVTTTHGVTMHSSPVIFPCD